jgi:hypothetical protein
MNQIQLDSIFKIADIHAQHIRFSIETLKARFPLSADDIRRMSRDDVIFFDFFINRFSKLQDFMGTKLFPSILDYAGESIELASLIDRLHQLEKIGAIQDAKKWEELRRIRNHLSHEYPDEPELTATYLNEAFNLAFYLLESLSSLQKYVDTHPKNF